MFHQLYNACNDDEEHHQVTWYGQEGLCLSHLFYYLICLSNHMLLLLTVSHDMPFPNIRCLDATMLCIFKCDHMLDTMECSINLQAIAVSDTGL